MKRQELIDRFRAARTDRTLAVLEGFHPLKHAIRFGAELLEVVATKDGELELLAADYAPDAVAAIKEHVRVMESGDFGKLAPVRPPTGVIAIAKRPKTTAAQILDNPEAGPVVLLENPRNLLNIGASIRVAAAAGAAGVVTTGPHAAARPGRWLRRAQCQAPRGPGGRNGDRTGVVSTAQMDWRASAISPWRP